MKEIIASNIAATVATIGLCIYFFCTAVVFLSKPEKYGKQYSVQPVDNAGKTEIRVYYGGISFALGLFLCHTCVRFRSPVLLSCRRTYFCKHGILHEVYFYFHRQKLELPLHKTRNPRGRRFYCCALDLFHHCRRSRRHTAVRSFCSLYYKQNNRKLRLFLLVYIFYQFILEM